jgi:hypothetical protein
MVRMRLLSLTLAVLALGAVSALGAVVYEAELMPDLVHPESGATAYGQATLIVNDAGTLADLTVNFAGLESAQTSAVLLRAGAGAAGTVIATLPLGTPLAMTMDYEGDLVTAIDADELAIQISSEDWPDGAIRGNFTFVIVGVDATTWSQVKTLFD